MPSGERHGVDSPVVEIPALTDFAIARLLSADDREQALTLTDEGHLLVHVSGETMTRTDDLLLCSDNLAIRPLNRRMQGRAVPEVFRRLVAMEGEGYLILSRRTERFHVVRLERDLCFFVEKHLWALETSLMWDVGMLPGSRRDGPIPLVRTSGEGLVAFRVPGSLVAVKVSDDRPLRVHREGLVGWVGNVIPTCEAGVPFLRCEGEGAVFVALPRAPEALTSPASDEAP